MTEQNRLQIKMQSLSMRQKLFSNRATWHPLIVLVLAAFLIPLSPSPAAAISLGDYFQISYDSIEFKQTEIHGNEVFYATIKGEATCIEDLPVPVSEASITSRVVAEHQINGTSEILNPSYTVTIKPFPNKKGDTTEINKVIPLQFPGESESGDYDVVGELIEAKVKVLLWIDVTSYLPSSQAMGSVTYIASSMNSPPNMPSNPSPADDAIGVSINTNLSWRGGDPDAGDTVTYDVYFGTSESPPLVSNNQTRTTYDPGTLSYNTKHCWKIIATDNHGISITSSLWDFTTQAAANNRPNTPSMPSGPKSGYAGISYSYSTSATNPDGDQLKYTFDWGDGITSETGFVNSGATVSKSHSWSNPGTYYVKAKASDSRGMSSEWSDPTPVTIIAAPNHTPNTPSNPSPANHASAVSINAVLSWSGGDPDAGDTVTYDVYLGTSENPPLVSHKQSTTTCTPGTLSHNSECYWKIVAIDSHGASATSPLWHFTTEPPQEQEMHIASIDMELNSGGWGCSPRYTRATATITVVDAQAKPVPEAEVSGHWSGASSKTNSGTSNSQGKVTFISDRVQNAAKGTTFTFTVDDLDKSGWTYDSRVNIKTSDSITLNPAGLGGSFCDILLLLNQLITRLGSMLFHSIGS